MLRSTEASYYALFNRLIAPLVVVACLLVLREAYLSGEFPREYMVLEVVAFFVSSVVFGELQPLSRRRGSGLRVDIRMLLLAWAVVIGALLFIGYVTKMSDIYSRRLLLTWIVLMPIVLLLAQVLTRYLIMQTSLGKNVRSAVIVGAGDLGLRFAQKVVGGEMRSLNIKGFFDDRSAERLPSITRAALAGKLSDLPRFVHQHRIGSIYITLPMASQRRTVELLEQLQDTTASIYFVPDVFTFSIVRTHLDEVGDMPVIAVSESPFKGASGLIKRLFDIVIAASVLMALSPLILLIALAVRLSSAGHVIFKQRRYGLDGEEIVVYKFRTMRVQEDGAAVPQARRDDPRVTRIGAFLRKTSLDELPQLANVLQGRMSIVGPRPHAIAHNEMYRKLIKGYMLRHKVKPGITGLAQIHGFRGETETIDKMQARVKYDIDYIRNWSVLLDLWILLRTLRVLYRDSAAY
jgi:putative colanic acid biosysnthesis UDP-glucose lipid carrier transferase